MKCLMACMAVFIVGPWMASGDKVTLCHFGETKQVKTNAVEGHLSHGDYLGPCVAPEPTPTPAPVSTAEPSKIVIENMWLLVSWADWDLRYCILISDMHPSIDDQVAKCFPGTYWRAHNTPCAGPIYANDVWACDDDLQERGWSRLSLADLCQRYPKWCDR